MKAEEQMFLSQTFGRASKSKVKKVETNLVVKYTRVSGGRQMENDSIENQNKIIDEFAKQTGRQIIATFGQTHESAKTDDRKEFKKMIDFCRRSNGKVSTILVYKMSRFSRSGGRGISIADDMRNKYGIHIIAVTEQVDTSHSSGVVMQNLQLLFAAWENAQRKEITQGGLKSKYEKGIWLTQVPPGYQTIIDENKERKIVINEEGKKIKKAWEWKYNGMSNEEISVKLVKLGVNMYKQKIYKIFKNPFYCGLIAHGILDGKVVEGQHEKMVSKDVFFKINEITQSSTRFGVPHKKENEQMPLKVFVKCSACGESMTGYIVKKKNLYYYKCRKKGCNCNKSTKQMHQLFLDLIKDYSIKKQLLPAIAYEYENAFREKNSEIINQREVNEKRIKEINKIIEDLDEQLYITKTITIEKYQNFALKYGAEKEKIGGLLGENSNSSSNLAQKIIQAGELCLKLPEIWEKGGYEKKVSLQKLVFPEGVTFDKKKGVLLTPKINLAITEIARISGDLAINEKGLDMQKQIKSLVAGRRFPSSNHFIQDLRKILDFNTKTL